VIQGNEKKTASPSERLTMILYFPFMVGQRSAGGGTLPAISGADLYASPAKNSASALVLVWDGVYTFFLFKTREFCLFASTRLERERSLDFRGRQGFN